MDISKSHLSDPVARASISFSRGSPSAKEKGNFDSMIKPMPSISQTSDGAEEDEEGEPIPSDPLDLVDFKVRHAAARESENAKISQVVEKFCKLR